VDNPAQSVRAAAAMIAAVTADRGYELTDHEQLLTDLSVYHGRYLDGYRQARGTAARAGQASTEALRRALISYRVLFYDLLGSSGAARQDPGRTPAELAPAAAKAPGPRPLQQVTKGLPWKTRREEDAVDVPATRS
jgi:hypothetical protein